MKKLVIFFLTISAFQAQAQNEGRFGIFGGANATMLFNADDAGYGDLLPTYNSAIGAEAAYHFTLFKGLPIGISVQVTHTKNGQNYTGEYTDSTRYNAFSRLNYIRGGGALHFGTNPRRQVALELIAGANIGFLTKYQERYELYRGYDSRYILDINDKEVSLFDSSEIKGTLTSPMYNKTDLNVFGSLGFNFLLSRDWVIGFFGRLDYGLTPIESTSKMNINFDTEPATSTNYKVFNTLVKYQGKPDDKIQRAATTNVAYGIYLTLKYRIFNKERTEWYFRENDRYNN